MTLGRVPRRSPAQGSAPPAIADVVLIGDGGPALDAADALGLRVSRSPGGRAGRALLGELHQPAVVVVAVAAAPLVPSVAALRTERPQLRVLLLTDDPTVTCPEGVDELLDIRLADDELVGRVIIHLAHARASAPRRLAITDDTVLDLDARALRRRGRLIHLRPLESRLLEELARSPGRPLSRDLLMERAWPSAPPRGSRTVDVHVRWLRQKLEPDPRRPVHLLTVRGLGYRLEPDPDAGMDGGPAPDGHPGVGC
jgi:DNA-binding winged helix-turn-helix (wHTH) protein